MADGRRDVALSDEQRYVNGLYARLDALRVETDVLLRRVLDSRAGGAPQARSERDAFANLYQQRIAQLWAVEDRLCFGRLDGSDGESHHVGRIGLSGEGQQILLIDWRAPAAEPFYRATAATPMGVRRRRHLRTRGRDVIGVDDEIFDVDALTSDERSELSGEAALLAALSESRTGRMRDVVATLQAEQDRVVRADRHGILVVQGGPGTGKTAVALHRAAYLLFTHRARLAADGVLLVGPTEAFLRYVGQVLPSLGETSVVLRTVGELLPGIVATGREPDGVAALKGGARMVDVVAAAVRDRQRLPRSDAELLVDGNRLALPRRVCEEARRRARVSRRPHNEARGIFVRHVLTHLAQQIEGAETWEAMEREERDTVLRDLIRTPAVRTAVNRLWPHLTPGQLLSDLFADPRRLERFGTGLSEAEIRLLRRPAGAAWTVADVPLLDEAAELIGETDPWGKRSRQRAEALRAREVGYAAEVLSGAGGGGAGFVDAAALAERYSGPREVLTAAEASTTDRSWTYGHIVVDEAQDLSWMAWRSLVRRCPSRSMTVVGDLAQAGWAWSSGSWKEALDDHAPGQWRVEELTVGYRTPSEVMAVAADVLDALDPTLVAPRAIRSAGLPPRVRLIGATVAGPELVEAVRAERLAVGGGSGGSGSGGRVAVIVPPAQADAVLAVLSAAMPGDVGDASDAAVAVLTVAQCKGLEFDAVVVLDPAAILASSPRGLGDLYVAVTRTTNRLLVLCPGPVPAVLHSLTPDPLPTS